MKNALRWIICLPLAVGCYLISRPVCFWCALVPLNLLNLSFTGSMIPVREWSATLQAPDMNGHFVIGTLLVLFVSFLPGLYAVMAACVCAPSRKTITAGVVASIGTLLFAAGAIANVTSSLHHTFSVYYRTAIETGATLTGLWVGFNMVHSASKEQDTVQIDPPVQPPGKETPGANPG